MLASSGCASVKVDRADPREYQAARRDDFLSTGELSGATRNLLFALGITRRECEQAAPVCIELIFDDEDPAGISDVRLAAIAEIAVSVAARDEKRSSAMKADLAIAGYLEAARYAYVYLFCGNRSPAARSLEDRQTQVRDYYNFATERIATLVFERARQANREHIPAEGDVRTVANWTLITGQVDVHPPLDALGLEEIVAASRLEIKGLRSTYRRDGLGAELVVVWRMPPERSTIPSEIAYQPATVLLRFDGSTRDELLASRKARIDVLDPYQRRVMRLHETDIRLAGDFSSPYALWLARSGFNGQAVRNLLGRENALDHPQVVLMQPYDPSRLTIVMIHGLASSPEAWVNVANEVLGDERLRDQFQIWQIYYPTNVPVAFSQLDVRRALEQAFRVVDPGGARAPVGM